MLHTNVHETRTFRHYKDMSVIKYYSPIYAVFISLGGRTGWGDTNTPRALWYNMLITSHKYIANYADVCSLKKYIHVIIFILRVLNRFAYFIVMFCIACTVVYSLSIMGFVISFFRDKSILTCTMCNEYNARRIKYLLYGAPLRHTGCTHRMMFLYKISLEDATRFASLQKTYFEFFRPYYYIII